MRAKGRRCKFLFEAYRPVARLVLLSGLLNKPFRLGLLFALFEACGGEKLRRPFLAKLGLREADSLLTQLLRVRIPINLCFS